MQKITIAVALLVGALFGGYASIRGSRKQLVSPCVAPAEGAVIRG